MALLRQTSLITAIACSLFLAACGGGTGDSSNGAVEVFQGGAPSVGPAPLYITTTDVPPGKPGVAYPTTSLETHGALGNVDWHVSAGTLPPGIALTRDGRLQGMPSTEGFYEFTAQATDGRAIAARELAIAVDTLGLRAGEGMHFGEAWTGNPVTVRTAGHEGRVEFAILGNETGGRLDSIDAVAGTAVWTPGELVGTDTLRVRDTTTGETAELPLAVIQDPTASHEARHGGHDVWFLDWNTKRGAHPFATDLRSAMAFVGLRGNASYGAAEREVDRLAEMAVKVEILRQINPLFLRESDGSRGEAGLPISFAFERPGSGYVSPAPGNVISGRSHGYSVMALCYPATARGAGAAFVDAVGNPNHEHNATSGAGALGVFMDFIEESIANQFVSTPDNLQNQPLTADDVELLKAVLHGRPASGRRFEVVRATVQTFARGVAVVAAHEVGHSLGLNHTPSFTHGAIMNAYAVLSPGVEYGFTSTSLGRLRAGLPGPGRMSIQALKFAGGTAAAATLASGGVTVCGGSCGK